MEINIRKRILIVDDAPALQRNYTKILKTHQPKVIVEIAKNGQEAVEKIKKSKNYDGIIMDIEMPTMDGVKAAQRIRELGYIGIILAHTILHQEEAKASIIRGEMNGFLLKQIGTDKLIAYLKKYNLI